MARILITHASRAGTTRDVATILADAFTGEGHDVVVASCTDNPTPAGFDLVIAGSGIHAGSWYSDAVGWLSRHADELHGRVALFNVCLNAANPAKRDEALGYNDGLVADLDPVAVASFAGRFVPDHVSFWKRVFLRTLSQAPQDHVDPAAITAWAEGVVIRAHGTS